MEQQHNVNGISTEHLASNLRMLRKRMNLSQEELASQIGLNRGNIASYENGSAEPKICSLLKLAEIFGVSIPDLVNEDLSDDHFFQVASVNFQQRGARDKSEIEKFESQIGEIQKVIEGLHTCHQFKVKSLGDDASREVQAMAHKFEELYELSVHILQNHRELIDFVKCRLKQKANC